MKKQFAAILLSLIMIFCFCSCGGPDKEAVNNALEGRWYYYWYASGVNKYCYSEYEFYDGEVAHYFMGSNETYDEGTYEITKDTIKITYDNGETEELNYTYENENVSLVDNGDDGTINNEYQKANE